MIRSGFSEIVTFLPDKSLMVKGRVIASTEPSQIRIKTIHNDLLPVILNILT